MTYDLIMFALTLLALSCAIVALTLVSIQSRSRRWLEYIGDHQRVLNVEQQIQLFSRLIEQSLAVRLHAPTHHALDTLLHKLAGDTITIAEARTLYRLILERSDELQLLGPEMPDLSFPRMLTLWSLEVRLAREGQRIKV